jgi:hypothetical protein
MSAADGLEIILANVPEIIEEEDSRVEDDADAALHDRHSDISDQGQPKVRRAKSLKNEQPQNPDPAGAQRKRKRVRKSIDDDGEVQSHDDVVAAAAALAGLGGATKRRRPPAASQSVEPVRLHQFIALLSQNKSKLSRVEAICRVCLLLTAYIVCLSVSLMV